jgi:preprotein translocase subunit SecD
MRGNSKIKVFIVIAVIILITLAVGYADGFIGIKDLDDLRTGIDIRGGVYTVLYPVLKEGQELDKENDLLAAKQKIRARLDAKGILDASVTIENDKGRIILEIPYKADDKDFNPQSVIDELGKTSLLTFREVTEAQYVLINNYHNDEYEITIKSTSQIEKDKQIAELRNKLSQNLKTAVADDENINPEDLILVEGKHVIDAKPGFQKDNLGKSENVIQLEFNGEGTKLFSEATRRLNGKKIAIFLDDEYIMAPTVNSVITDGNAIITGNYTIPEAKEQAAIIKAGALPFSMEAKEIRSISPTLGKGALDITVKAGIIAFMLVFIYMLLYYRLPGLIANIALFGLVVAEVFFILQFGITLTLPGIAGIILSIGMGVDANIIITERIREELKSGKTLKASIDVGFKRALTAIIDANITTVISGFALVIFGTGPIKGFAYTLIIGILLSFLTAVLASRIMLRSVSSYEFAKIKWLYGVAEGGK